MNAVIAVEVASGFLCMTTWSANFYCSQSKTIVRRYEVTLCMQIQCCAKVCESLRLIFLLFFCMNMNKASVLKVNKSKAINQIYKINKKYRNARLFIQESHPVLHICRWQKGVDLFVQQELRRNLSGNRRSVLHGNLEGFHLVPPYGNASDLKCWGFLCACVRYHFYCF